MRSGRGAVSHSVTLGGLLRAATERWPTWPALESGRRVWRYEELDAAVDAAVGMLAGRGVAPGDRIAVVLRHGAALLAVPFIASRLGVSALLLSTALARERWGWQLEAADPVVVLSDRAHAADLAAFDVEVFECDGDDPGLGARGQGVGARPAPEGNDSDSTLLYVGTSGTTGSPKLTCLTERGLFHAARGYLSRTRLHEGERSFVVMPLSYIGPRAERADAAGRGVQCRGRRCPSRCGCRPTPSRISTPCRRGSIGSLPGWCSDRRRGAG
jgi:non-ribosomal peptide synthetase component F